MLMEDIAVAQERSLLKNTSGKYPYEYAENDPLQTHIYTLQNGLKVYISPNADEPRIQTMVAVKAGSKNDPAETTGLAHYLEHMLFKGTSKFGTSNWEAEKKLLQGISDLYEQHRNTNDAAEKKRIYHQIDSLSTQAAQHAIPSEYDKMVTALGATGTNAYTSNEQTVYINNIPSTALEKWVKIESERFQELVLRLFHTELETVYEEFNMGQDNDYRKSYKSLFKGLFPNHPYGTQTTIGEGEHLKNPSMVNIHRYFSTYYVPNNMAVILAGDVNPDAAIALCDEYFGKWQPKPIPPFQYKPEQPIAAPQVSENYGSQAEHLYLGFRFEGANSRDALLLRLMSRMLENGQAGLFDIDLMQKQKVLDVGSYEMILHDYSAHILYGVPREGQTLQEVKDLMLQEIEKIKKGDFEPWLLEAVLKNYRLETIKGYEDNRNRASALVSAFVLGVNYADYVALFDELDQITREDIIAFAQKNYGNNYVVTYKYNGEDKNVHKVEKPEITPLNINRSEQSPFVQGIEAMSELALEPVFLDYQKDIETTPLNTQIPFSYIRNKNNELFKLYYLLDMGTDHVKELDLAIRYLPYLGTDRYSAEDLKKEFFKLGLKFDVFSARDKVYVQLSGLGSSLEEGVKLFEHILAHVKADPNIYNELVETILKERADAKLSKQEILQRALTSYAKYGAASPYTYIMSEEELRNADIERLVQYIKTLTQYKHRIFYYGPDAADNVKEIIKKYHRTPALLSDYPKATVFRELDQTQNHIYFADYKQKQIDLMLLSRDETYNPKNAAAAYIFNEYFGAGLSSIVFQEIREAKALAYTAYSSYTTPVRQNESHYLVAYIGTQADKLTDALNAMMALLNDMPEAARQFEGAKEAALKKIESQRFLGDRIFWDAEAARSRGLSYDLRRDIYAEIKTMTLPQLKAFFQQHVKNKSFAYLLLGDKSKLDLEAVQKIAPVQELSLEQLFGY